jgi:hypothetical protein
VRNRKKQKSQWRRRVAFHSIDPFSDFRCLNTRPRFPENKDLCVTLDSIDRSNELMIFVSHCWLAGWDGAEAWRGRPHPDNKQDEKYHLTVEGIARLRATLAPEMTEVYLWLDFGCIDQDGNPARELKQLDKIVLCCACLFTLLVGPASMSSRVSNVYKEYGSSAWNCGLATRSAVGASSRCCMPPPFRCLGQRGACKSRLLFHAGNGVSAPPPTHC